MRIKFFLPTILFLIAGVTGVFAQEQSVPANPRPKMVKGGIINGKATNLVKPAYPAAAKAARAEGTVNVEVTIDEEGNVISAAAVSGHPLLRAAAVEAARASKFSPTRLSGQPVQVTGIIVYSFLTGGTPIPEGAVIRRGVSSWFNTGMSISALDNIPSLRFYEPSSLNYTIPAEWSEERAQIKRLDELKKAEIEASPGDAPKERVIDDSTSTDMNKNQVRTTTIVVATSPERKVSSEVTAISQSLTASIRGRLAASELDLWYFNLGIYVNKALLDADSPSKEKRIDGVRPYREFIRNVPAGLPETLAADLEKVAQLAERGIFTDQDKIEMTRLMSRLNTIPQK